MLFPVLSDFNQMPQDIKFSDAEAVEKKNAISIDILLQGKPRRKQKQHRCYKLDKGIKNPER